MGGGCGRAWGVIREWEAELTDSAGARGGGATDGSEEVSERVTRWIIRHGTRSIRKRRAHKERVLLETSELTRLTVR
jgi:hypothetical protein